MIIANTKLGIKDLFLLIVIGILSIALMFKQCSEPQVITKTKDVYKYKTDTVYVNNGYKEKYDEIVKLYNKKSKVTPPKTVTIYKDSKPNDIVIYKIPDSLSLQIATLKRRINIADNYIKNFPKNDKLIDFKLIKDSLNITTLNIDGITSKKEYPLYLDLYGYSWYDNELHNFKVKNNVINKNRFNQMYLYTGYDLLKQSPALGLEYYLIINKFKVGANSMLLINKDSNFVLSINIGYRLF